MSFEFGVPDATRYGIATHLGSIMFRRARAAYTISSSLLLQVLLRGIDLQHLLLASPLLDASVLRWHTRPAVGKHT